MPFDEVVCLTRSDASRVAFGKQSIGYIFYTRQARRKSFGIQVENILNNS